MVQGRNHEISSGQVKGLCGRDTSNTRMCVCAMGSGGMLPQEVFGFLDPLKAFLVLSGGKSEATEV